MRNRQIRKRKMYENEYLHFGVGEYASAIYN